MILYKKYGHKGVEISKISQGGIQIWNLSRGNEARNGAHSVWLLFQSPDT